MYRVCVQSPVCSLEALARADDQLKVAPGDKFIGFHLMLEAVELQKLAKTIVERRLPSIHLDEVLTEPITDSDGEAALRITLVLTPESAGAISGDEGLKLLVAIRDALFRKGEERFPIVEYATADDVPYEEE